MLVGLMFFMLVVASYIIGIATENYFFMGLGSGFIGFSLAYIMLGVVV